VEITCHIITSKPFEEQFLGNTASLSLNPESSIYVAGHRGMVGAAIMRKLGELGYTNLVTRTHSELDLTCQQDVKAFFKEQKPDYVFLAAARVGGIAANNKFPADFIYDNVMIESNIIHAAFQQNVKRLLFLGSSCIYPRLAEQPMSESALLTGTLEPTNEPYALAKIAGIKLCESFNRQHDCDFRSVMPTNLYGPNDNFHPDNSHVIPALLRRFHEAKQDNLSEVVVWGSGNPKREFLHVDDMAAASVHVMNLEQATYQANTRPMLSHINVGSGKDNSIRELAEAMARVTEFQGDIVFDNTKPDGAPRKLLDVSKLSTMGWNYSIELEAGLESTYQWYLENQGKFRD
jgi:GDP-L-fucose synthase